MAGTYITSPRSYSNISLAVQKCRELGALGTSIDFCITDFIVGPLMDYLRGRLGIEFCARNEINGPAEVIISKYKNKILLRVTKETWDAAREGFADARRVLAHEIGHIWLHRDDKFGFTDDPNLQHLFISSDSFVENQAHNFADLFLLPDEPVLGFDNIENLIHYCDLYSGVPIDVINRRFYVVHDIKRYYFRPRHEPGIICHKCGEEKITIILSVQRCDNCNHISY